MKITKLFAIFSPFQLFKSCIFYYIEPIAKVDTEMIATIEKVKR